MSVCVIYPLTVIVCLLIVLFAELSYWLIRWATGHGLAMADAMAEIAAAHATHRMSLRFQLYRYATGRHRRRLRTVCSTSRPRRLRNQYADPTALQLRALSILAVTLIAGYAYVAVTALAKLHSYMESIRPGDRAIPNLLAYAGCVVGIMRSHLRLFNCRDRSQWRSRLGNRGGQLRR
jgi:hypothetical protein